MWVGDQVPSLIHSVSISVYWCTVYSVYVWAYHTLLSFSHIISVSISLLPVWFFLLTIISYLFLCHTQLHPRESSDDVIICDNGSEVLSLSTLPHPQLAPYSNIYSIIAIYWKCPLYCCPPCALCWCTLIHEWSCSNVLIIRFICQYTGAFYQKRHNLINFLSLFGKES